MPCNGYVIDGTPIAVDVWLTDRCPHARLFFLTHFHSDHIFGLTRTWDFSIYTSTITAELLINIIGIDPSFIKCLQLNETYIIPLDFEDNEVLEVTAYDANHCPGSVMFLFKGYFGNIFYTGDFRYIPGLLDFAILPTIDILYLDNTYCSSKCQFPKQETAIDTLLQRINGCLRCSKRMFIGVDNLGKEEVLTKISKETHLKLCVTERKQKILNVLGVVEGVTCDESNCKIFVVPTNYISGFSIEKLNKETPTCAILATARYCGFNFQPFCHQKNIHVIPLSNHSSFLELAEFVKAVRPRKIIPIIGKDVRGVFNTDISERADMSVFRHYLNSTPSVSFAIPESVLEAIALWHENRPPAEPIGGDGRSVIPEDIYVENAGDAEYVETSLVIDSADMPPSISESSHSTDIDISPSISESSRYSDIDMPPSISESSQYTDIDMPPSIYESSQSTDIDMPPSIYESSQSTDIDMPTSISESSHSADIGMLPSSADIEPVLSSTSTSSLRIAESLPSFTNIENSLTSFHSDAVAQSGPDEQAAKSLSSVNIDESHRTSNIELSASALSMELLNIEMSSETGSQSYSDNGISVKSFNFETSPSSFNTAMLPSSIDAESSSASVNVPIMSNSSSDESLIDNETDLNQSSDETHKSALNEYILKITGRTIT